MLTKIFGLLTVILRIKKHWNFCIFLLLDVYNQQTSSELEIHLTFLICIKFGI